MNAQRNSNAAPASRKARDQAFILPFVGLVLLIPPFANIFQIDTLVAGIPLTALYLFLVWALLIIGAAFLSRKLHESPPSDPNGDAVSSENE